VTPLEAAAKAAYEHQIEAYVKPRGHAFDTWEDQAEEAQDCWLETMAIALAVFTREIAKQS
jgi:hypothetical protein